MSQAFSKVVHPADENIGYNSERFVPIFAKIKYTEDGKLSISGVVGPRSNGDAAGSCGQILMSFKEYDKHGHTSVDDLRVAEGWTPELVRRFFDAWDRWHLNDIRAGCEHQRANWDTSEELEVVYYGLTSEAQQTRRRAIERASVAAASRVEADLSEQERALVLMNDWFKDRAQPPDADSPLSGCFEVRKREIKAAGWVYRSEHSRGLLMKPCETCGYKYGSAWLKEEVPAEVLDFLRSLPDTDRTPAWV